MDSSNGPRTTSDSSIGPTTTTTQAPRPKSFACILCRRRKLKCDGKRPICTTCRRLGHACGYAAANKSTTKDNAPAQLDSLHAPSHTSLPDEYSHLDPAMIDELTDLFFGVVSVFVPLIHRERYMAQCQLPPEKGTPLCLRYIVWANGAMLSPRYRDMADMFYRVARKHIEMDQLYGFGDRALTLPHVQCWYWIAAYEVQNTCFPKSWQSSGRCVRLAQTLGLQQMDKRRATTKQIIPPASDDIEVEERRRAFWAAYCADRWSSSPGFPLMIDESRIFTRLPGSDQAFREGKIEETPYLDAIKDGQGLGQLDHFAVTVYLAHLTGRTMTHVQDQDDADETSNFDHGAFWARHRELDNLLSNMFLAFPSTLRLPAGRKDPNAIFLNMSVHSFIIALHQAAAYAAHQYGLPADVAKRSKDRCLIAAEEILDILRSSSHLDLSKMHPAIGAHLIAAATVFNEESTDEARIKQNDANLRFIRAALVAMRDVHPCTGSFLLALDHQKRPTGPDDSSNTQGSTPDSQRTSTTTDGSHSAPQHVYSPATSSSVRSRRDGSESLQDEIRRDNGMAPPLNGIMPIRTWTKKEVAPQPAAQDSMEYGGFPTLQNSLDQMYFQSGGAPGTTFDDHIAAELPSSAFNGDSGSYDMLGGSLQGANFDEQDLSWMDDIPLPDMYDDDAFFDMRSKMFQGSSG